MEMKKMDNLNDGGPAFPLHNHGAQTLGMHVSGMSLRDYFAAKALSAYMDGGDVPNDFLMIARRSYAMADAMLAAREEI